MASPITSSVASECRRILVVDDEACFSRFVESLFRKEDVDVTGCRTSRDARNLLRREAFDLAVLDQELPDGSGLELLQWLRACGITTPCVMVTANGSIEMAVEAMKSGAADFVTKAPSDRGALARSLERNLENADRSNGVAVDLGRDNGGEGSQSPTAATDVRNLCASLDPPVELSRREYEVLAAVLQGLSNKEIGSALFISVRTVKNHLTQIYRKFDVESRPQLFNRVLVSR